MLPPIPKVSLTEAKYTVIFDTVIGDTETFDVFWDFLDRKSDIIDADMLADMIKAKFRYYEICDDTYDENTDRYSVFLNCLEDTYNEYYKFYEELLENYKKEYDYATGNKRIVQRNDSSSSESSRSAEGKSNNTNREYDLPNKVVSPTDENGYLTGKTTDDGGNSLDENKSATAELESSVTTIFADEFLDLKRKYLAQIRNVYSEFADKFKDCFLHIY